MSERNPEQAGIVAGGCLCGTVRFELAGKLRDVLICHCVTCRRQHTLIGAYTACEPAQLTLTRSDSLTWYESSTEASRGFCSRCGAGLFWAPRHGRHISVAVGSLDRPESLKIDGHIFTHQQLALLPVMPGAGVREEDPLSEVDPT